MAKQMAAEFEIMPLFEIGYHMIGQQQATERVVDSIAGRGFNFGSLCAQG